MVHQPNNLPSEQKSDIDFLCQLQHVTSPSAVINADGDSSWLKLVHDPIIAKPTPTSSRRRCRHLHQLAPYPQSPLSSDENAVSRPTRRSLFSGVTTSTPLRDIGNSTPRPSYRRCASDTAAVADCGRLYPTPLTKSHSMSTAVLSADAENDDHKLVGDFTRPLCLPIVSDTKHCDLNTISHHTVCPTHFDIVYNYTASSSHFRRFYMLSSHWPWWRRIV